MLSYERHAAAARDHAEDPSTAELHLAGRISGDTGLDVPDVMAVDNWIGV